MYISGYVSFSLLDLFLYNVRLLMTTMGVWCRSSNKMPKAVKAAIEDAVRIEGGKAEEEAKAFVKAMVDEGRLFEECWS